MGSEIVFTKIVLHWSLRCILLIHQPCKTFKDVPRPSCCDVKLQSHLIGGRQRGGYVNKLALRERVELIKGDGATQLRYCWLNSSLLCIVFSSITNARIHKLWRLQCSFCPLDGRSIWIISSSFDVSCCLEEEERRKKLLGNKTLLF